MQHVKLFKLFLKLGFFAFGGPAAHISMMYDEVVTKNEWFTDQEFLNMISFTNLIPGPNSTEMAILIGYKMGGILGLLISGLSFIIPAVLIVLGFTHFYVHYYHIPQIQNVFNGMLPSIFLIISLAVFKLSRKTIKSKEETFLLAGLFVLLILGISEFLILLVGGIYFLLKNYKNKLLSIEPFSFSILFLLFLKIGSILYGSGYVLISFLQTELVNKNSWLTLKQLVDLVAIGEITPGPVFTTATAIGYYLGRVKGAFISTVGIFTPSFIFIGIISPIYDKLKEKQWIQELLQGLSIASLAIMYYVSFNLAKSILSNIQMIIFTFSMIVIWKLFKLKSPYLILIGATLGFIFL